MPDVELPVENPADTIAFIGTARERYQFGLDVDQIDRNEAEADNKFANASDLNKDQWSEIPLRSREANHRPVLQWNRIPVYLQQVGNDGRQNKPSIQVAPGDGGVKATADWYQSRIRQIEYDCDADVAYDTARDQQLASGRGFIRVTLKYKKNGVDQEICIDPIDNQFSVVFDPGAKQYNRGDAKWCFVASMVTEDAFRRDYGQKALDNVSDWYASDDYQGDWITEGKTGKLIRVCEYWLEESAGQVCQYVIDGSQVLDKTDWIGSRIPIFPQWGRQAVVQGIRRTYSLIRNAKDPQRLVNLYVSNIAEQIAMMPKAPYEAPIGSIADNHIADWRDAGTTAKAVLFYQEWDEQGRQLTKPTRVQTEPPIQALTIGLSQAIDGIKAAMGIFDASLGARSNETSGKAIERRKQSAEIVNFHFPDNEARTRKAIGETLVELIAKIDKPGMQVPIRHEDGKTEVVPIGESYRHPKTGEEVIHNPDQGQYGVVISTGPSYQSARQDEHERLVQIVEAMPDLMRVIGDQVIRTSDFPGSDDIADRLENWIKAQSPGIIPEKTDGPPIPPQVKAAVVQLQQQLQTTQQFAQSLHEKLETKQPELDNAVKLKQMELDFEREKLQVTSTTQLSVAEIKAGVDADIEILRSEIARIDQERGFHMEQQAAADEHKRQQELNEQQQAAALTQQDQKHGQALEQQAAGHQATLEQQDNQAANEPQEAQK